ncbi:uncharacterized protein LOC113839175 [Cricetulus griseus]|uniref:Uncharacterized protein LOC113839175 n=1 Tax=Cricetulus griseus TaxID=10029 RepID=A0A9J7K3X4_CRIGR|nr:uncharacterized protein LOC113839175 [Cricetulus griseus]XP_035310453.1 uncharacterized protein LOC113839175 [Cricetulus griseus]
MGNSSSEETQNLLQPGHCTGKSQDQQDPVWVPEQLIRKIQHEEHHECQCGDASSPSHDESTGDGGAEMGDTVSVPKTYADGEFPEASPTGMFIYLTSSYRLYISISLLPLLLGKPL